MAADVTALRNSIVRIENGEAVTEPFDLERARAMYLALFGPVDAEVRGTEASDIRTRRTDAAAAALLLPASQQGSTPTSRGPPGPMRDPFDFTGVDWLGRGREVSISVSPRSFLDMRALRRAGRGRPISGLAKMRSHSRGR